MKSQMLKVKRMFPLNNGIFHYINYSFPEEITITQDQLDLLFISSWGMRIVAPVVLISRDDMWEDNPLTVQELTYLGSLIKNAYQNKWDKLAAVLSLEYDPIHNYSDTYHEEMEEHGTGDDVVTHNTTVTDNSTVDNDKVVTDSGSERTVKTGSDTIDRSESYTIDKSDAETGTDTIAKQKQDSSTRTDNLNQEVTGAQDDGIYGFNSEEAVGADTSSTHTVTANTGTQGLSASGTESSTRTANLTHTINDDRSTDVDETKSSSHESTVYGGLVKTTDDVTRTQGTRATTGTDSTEKENERTRVRDFTHLGNIGNLTTQQLIEQEIKLWHWNFINQVLNDVKDFLTIPVYE